MAHPPLHQTRERNQHRSHRKQSLCRRGYITSCPYEFRSVKYFTMADKKTPKILDYLVDFDPKARFDLEISIRESGQVILFHSHNFKDPIGWFEYDLKTRELVFILDDGTKLDIGLPLNEAVGPHMQNAHQILMVLMDPQTGEAQRGSYFPLILQTA